MRDLTVQGLAGNCEIKAIALVRQRQVFWRLVQFSVLPLAISVTVTQRDSPRLKTAACQPESLYGRWLVQPSLIAKFLTTRQQANTSLNWFLSGYGFRHDLLQSPPATLDSGALSPFSSPADAFAVALPLDGGEMVVAGRRYWYADMAWYKGKK